MQRAMYLSQLYDSIANIPPDIQQCLLTIAQYGCDPSQLDRWYGIVRQHYGVSWVEPTQDHISVQYFQPVSCSPNAAASSNLTSMNSGLAMLSPSVSPKLEEYADATYAHNDSGTASAGHIPVVDNSCGYSDTAIVPVGRPLLPKSIPVSKVLTSSAKQPTKIQKRRQLDRAATRKPTQPPVRPSRPVVPFRTGDQQSHESASSNSGVLPFETSDEGLHLGQVWQLGAGVVESSTAREPAASFMKLP